ncbi:hypothetical protein THAOC_26726, partial [Thalassiosira oceanica]
SSRSSAGSATTASTHSSQDSVEGRRRRELVPVPVKRREGGGAGDTVLCGIASKMAETKDLGYGISMGDLQLTNFETLADLETRCSITIPVATMELADSSSAIKSAGLIAVGAIAAVIALV